MSEVLYDVQPVGFIEHLKYLELCHNTVATLFLQ